MAEFDVFRRTLSVTRYEAGTMVKGRWQEGTSSQFDIEASVQPVQPEEMALVPENRRDSARYALYTDTLLRPATEEGQTNADKVTIDSVDYEVIAVGHW